MGVAVRLTNPCTQGFGGTFEGGPVCRALTLPQASAQAMRESKAVCEVDNMTIAWKLSAHCRESDLDSSDEANVTLVE